MKENKLVYVALGSNLGDRKNHLVKAINLLKNIALNPIRQSFIYECPSQGVEGLPDFYNQVVEFETDWAAYDLLCFLKGAELILGRKHRKRWHSREIDIDLLWYDFSIIKNKYFTVPHNQLKNRQFVLQPLSDLNPQLEIPVLGKTVSKLLEELLKSETTADLQKVI